MGLNTDSVALHSLHQGTTMHNHLSYVASDIALSISLFQWLIVEYWFGSVAQII